MQFRVLNIITLSAVIITSAALFGCNGNDTNGNTGTLEVYMHDTPVQKQEVNIFIEKINVIREDGDMEVLGELDQSYNILKFINGDKELLADRDIEAGRYSGLEVVFGESHSVVVDGNEYEMDISENREKVLDLGFDLDSGEQKVLNIDIDAQQSVSQNGDYVFDPAVRVYKDSERITLKGNVLPNQAHSRVIARSGGNIYASTRTDEASGEFQLMGVEPGTYDLEIIPYDEEFYSAHQSNLILEEAGSTRELGTYGLDESRLITDENWTRRDLSQGVELLQKHDEIDGELRYISILAVDVNEPATDIGIFTPYFFGNDPHRMPISEYGKQAHALAATNAGFAPGGDEYHNYGIIKVDGEVLPYAQKGTSDEIDDILEGRHFMGSSAFGIDSDGKWHFRQRDGDTWDDDWPEVEHAIAGGHMLISDSEILDDVQQQEYDGYIERNHILNQHPRTTVCKTSDNVAAIFAIDGRHNQAAGMTLLEVAEFMLELGCENAINYDGGGSTTMWTEQHSVVNHPTDNDEFDNEGQRDLRNALIIRTQ